MNSSLPMHILYCVKILLKELNKSIASTFINLWAPQRLEAKFLSSFKICVCMWYMCLYLCLWVRVHMFMYVCVSKTKTWYSGYSSIVLHFFIWDRFLTRSSAHQLAKWAVHQAPRMESPVLTYSHSSRVTAMFSHTYSLYRFQRVKARFSSSRYFSHWASALACFLVGITSR